MTDRFKFRAKLKGMDKWVYGAYLKMLPYQPNPVGRTKPLETEYKHLIITEGSADWGMPREITAYEVIPETVGQCTGLKDKNSKLICEGDILLNIARHDKPLYVVKWNKSQAQFYTEMINPKKYELYAEWNLGRHDLDYEVIGNIYQDSLNK